MGILDFIFPKRCVGCGKLGAYFCPGCRARLRPVDINESICPMCERPAIDGVTHPRCKIRYGIDGLTSFFHYDGPVRAAVKAIKYRYVSDLAKEFVSLASVLSLPRADSIIPIPLHQNRQMERGFNQAEKLAEVLASRLHIPIRTDILTRTRATVPQVSMNHRDDRLKNMRGVFAVHPGAAPGFKDKDVLLFDDVFTTGATMREAANILKRAGIDKVWAVTMAR